MPVPQEMERTVRAAFGVAHSGFVEALLPMTNESHVGAISTAERAN
jgi:hypothetical protein